MLKRLLLLALSFCIIYPSDDPRLRALADEFEKRGQASNNEQRVTSEEHAQMYEDAFKQVTQAHPEIMNLLVTIRDQAHNKHQQLLLNNKQLESTNKELLANPNEAFAKDNELIDQLNEQLNKQNQILMMNADSNLIKERQHIYTKIEQKRKAEAPLVYSALASIAAVGIGGLAKSSAIHDDWQKKDGTIRTEVLPWLLSILHFTLPNESFFAEDIGYFQINIGTDQLYDVVGQNILNKINSNEFKINSDGLLSKRENITQLIVSSIAGGVSLKQDLPIKLGSVVICRKNQLLTACTKTFAKFCNATISSPAQVGNHICNTPKDLTKNIVSEAGYPLLAQAVHHTAHKLHINPYIVKPFIRKDGKVTNMVQLGVKTVTLAAFASLITHITPHMAGAFS